MCESERYFRKRGEFLRAICVRVWVCMIKVRGREKDRNRRERFFGYVRGGGMRFVLLFDRRLLIGLLLFFVYFLFYLVYTWLDGDVERLL